MKLHPIAQALYDADKTIQTPKAAQELALVVLAAACDDTNNDWTTRLCTQQLYTAVRNFA